MSLSEVEQAKRNVVLARHRLDTIFVAFQQRIRPASLAGEAWDEVKDKGADLADTALTAVRQRPAAVTVAIGAFALFLARAPLKRAVGRMFADGDEDDGRIVTRIETDDAKFNASTPIVDAIVTQGVN